MRPGAREQRVAAYAVIVRDDLVLLSRLAPRITTQELWTLPGGGLDHGEDPRDAVVREVTEETGLAVTIGTTARLSSVHQPEAWRRGRRVDAHALRIVYDGWVAPDAPAPRTLEVGGSTIEAAWQPLASVLDGSVPTTSLVKEALAQTMTARHQRVAAYAVMVRGDVRGDREPEVLMTRTSALAPHPGRWMLPGGGVEHGEAPRDAVAREVAEETGLTCEVGEVLEVTSTHFEGTAPSGRHEDFHALGLVFATTVTGDPDADPRVVEVGGTTDAAAWVPLTQVEDGSVPVGGAVRDALAAWSRRTRDEVAH